MDLSHIRNFSIIAHIDHGKSTLADRMLEVTKTIPERKMRDQMLDTMELEQERGITIKMQPVRMEHEFEGKKYILNLIDTPGHIDFSYEVSRALKAVEGSILLVDATQGVQAQTFTTLEMAKKAGLKIIPALSKVDSPLARVDEIKEEVMNLLDIDPDDILLVSGKTGEGVSDLLDTLIQEIEPPKEIVLDTKSSRGLVFDFEYSNHKGVIIYVRLTDGEIKKGDQMIFGTSKRKFFALDVGVFKPDAQSTDTLKAGEIGYVVTGIKEAKVAQVGDTVTLFKNQLETLPGYMEPTPVVWASVYPESTDDFELLKTALGRLQLSDSSLSFEEEVSGTLGRGFRVGCLGMLHLEIIGERLRREFDLDLIITSPSVTYEVMKKNGDMVTVYSAALFPDHGDVGMVEEPWVEIKIITPGEYLGGIMTLLYEHEGETGDTKTFGDGRTQIMVMMPLRELMRNFFDNLKSVSSGYASISYEIKEMRTADVTRLDVLVAEEPVAAFARIVSTRRADIEADETVEKLYKALPRQMFVVKIQAKVLGRIVASRRLSALKKDVTAKLYGGDITRKMKLREKQKKGKKKMAAMGKVNISHDVFLKMMKK
ncbi:MAG: translation elongation factor 4 [Candidatus Pacebacteria bacterium]|nr:translation elongation factor 4 [Candidatus Paceibacterota bacterium]